MKSLLCSLSLGLSLPLLAQSGGTLTPPAAPGVTMKSLDEVEARTAISSLPFTISAAGSYYLTDNLTSTGQGITITSSNVTLDLNGFNLTGSKLDGLVGVKVEGVASSPISNITVKNGSINGFNTGAEASICNNCQFINLLCHDQRLSGIYLKSSGEIVNNNLIKNCHVTEAGYIGIYLHGAAGSCNGNQILQCSATESSSTGIYIGCSSSGEANGNILKNCTISDSSWVGLQFNYAKGGIIKNCTISNSANSGCSLNNCDGLIFQENTVYNSTLQGVRITSTSGSQFLSNTIDTALNHGFVLTSGLQNRIEGNHVSGVTSTSTSYGIYVSGGRNLVVKNSAIGQDSNFYLTDTNSYGPVVTTLGSNATIYPWANFSLN